MLKHPSGFAQVTPDKVAYRMAGSGETLTYRQLDQRSNQGAQALRALGVGQGDHIALLFENSLDFVVLTWAAQRSGPSRLPLTSPGPTPHPPGAPCRRGRSPAGAA